VRNVIVAQLSTTYKRVKKAGNTLYLLTALSVREVSEADGKYSAVVSAPFPLSILNLLFGSLVLAAKSPSLNLTVLHLYFFPIMLVQSCLFLVYQVLILPLAYLKVAGHKWALVIKAPRGKGSSSSLDRSAQALVFMVLGLPIMTGNVVVDMFWFFKHLYKMDLDKSVTKKTKAEEVAELPEIHRRTYKKMLKYFADQNDQLVLSRHVSEDLRKYLNVDEGIRCLIFGKPSQIPEDKINFYMAYARHISKVEEDGVEEGKNGAKSQDEEEEDDDFFNIERIVGEYSTIKSVLINNSFPVDIAVLQSGAQFNVGSQTGNTLFIRRLFDKKIFLALL